MTASQHVQELEERIAELSLRNASLATERRELKQALGDFAAWVDALDIDPNRYIMGYQKEMIKEAIESILSCDRYPINKGERSHQEMQEEIDDLNYQLRICEDGD